MVGKVQKQQHARLEGSLSTDQRDRILALHGLRWAGNDSNAGSFLCGSLHPDPDFDCERCHAEGRACEILWWLKPEHERLLDEEGMDDPTVGSTLINPGDEGTSTDEDMDDVNLDVGWAGWLGGRARACSACAASDKKKKCSWSGKSVRVIWDYMPFTPWAQPGSSSSSPVYEFGMSPRQVHQALTSGQSVGRRCVLVEQVKLQPEEDQVGQVRGQTPGGRSANDLDSSTHDERDTQTSHQEEEGAGELGWSRVVVVRSSNPRRAYKARPRGASKPPGPAKTRKTASRAPPTSNETVSESRAGSNDPENEQEGDAASQHRQEILNALEAMDSRSLAEAMAAAHTTNRHGTDVDGDAGLDDENETGMMIDDPGNRDNVDTVNTVELNDVMDNMDIDINLLDDLTVTFDPHTHSELPASSHAPSPLPNRPHSHGLWGPLPSSRHTNPIIQDLEDEVRALARVSMDVLYAFTNMRGGSTETDSPVWIDWLAD